VARDPSNNAKGPWAGGLVGGQLDSDIINCYFLKAGGNTNGVGRPDTYGKKAEMTGLSDAEMKRGASFPGFDFDAVWTIDEGHSYPALRAASVGNEPVKVTGAAAIWSYGGNLHVHTDRPAMLTVYSAVGALVRQQTVGADETTTLPLPQGIYIVKLGDTTAKVAVRF
jgi:hypothetical protein